ncbi:M60 family metallopeptidase [Sphingobacterium bovistauri]|uniref:F5/8 type C domain-containing protein n=1 Tax=Sphingobacterium bovistauri TaxID=2781959 RepID=A0ABS7ZB36_9SPHI|nr:M60 family metallopeptidase [Sphingobacterium bovistauri]MCA5005909.1 hypothetical protein [Sphingobacterium bovistauri]
MSILSCGKYGYDFADGWQEGDKTGTDPVDTSLTYIDRSKLDRARIFPGLVGSNVRRAQDTTVTLNLNFRSITAEDLMVNYAPMPVYSTGVYAPAGENIKIEVPAGAEGITVQIGSQSNDLSEESIMYRDANVVTSKSLVVGTNYIRNPYGGLIWIKPSIAIANPVNFKFSNVVRSSDYVQGKSNQVEWLKDVENNDVPWLEIRSERVVFTVPRSLVLQYKSEINIESTLLKWKEIYEEDFYKVMGLTPHNAITKNSYPELPERGVLDIQVRRPYYSLPGYPWTAYMDKYWFNRMTSTDNLLKNSIADSWDVYHLIGHNYQMWGGWSWKGLEEVTNNLFILKAATRVGLAENSLSEEVKRLITKSLTFADKNTIKNFNTSFGDGDDSYYRLTPFLQIFEKVKGKNGENGWDFFTFLYKEARNSSYYFGGLDQAKMDYFYRALCAFTGKDYARFMQAWGIPVSVLAQKDMRKLYPALDVAVWKYNPITNSGGDESLSAKYDMSSPDFLWTSNMATATNESLGSFKALSDGLTNTYWHTCWDGCSINTTASESSPTNLDLDTKLIRLISGVYLQNRQGNTYRRRAIIYTRTVETAAWVKQGELVLANDNNDPTKDARKEFKFAEVVDARYIRFSFIEDNFDNSPHTALAEAGAFYESN